MNHVSRQLQYWACVAHNRCTACAACTLGGIVCMVFQVARGLMVRTSWYSYSRGQNIVYVPFSFYGCSTVRNIPFRFYGIFCSYVEIIADSAINGVERDM